MRILLLNPNTTASMTEKAAASARLVAADDVEIVARNPVRGPASIQGPADGEAALPGLFEEVDKAVQQDLDAIIIACFDDTGLDQVRQMSARPSVGIGEAAFHCAMMLGARFSVVTTLSVSVPVIEDNIARYGLASSCCRVRASEVPVLDLEKPGSAAREKVSAEIGVALREDNCGAIVLGCAGMADLAADLSDTHGVPVIDGVAAAVGMASALVRLR